MNNFTYYNPVQVVFGKGSIAKLSELIPAGTKIMLIYGGGSIKYNGVYDQVVRALQNHTRFEFGGIEPNPQYDTCLQAVDSIRKQHADYLLAVGGGSVIDATKFIAAAACYEGKDPWEICTSRGDIIQRALPLACVLTLPATGSEMNCGSVISRAALHEKRTVISPHTFPRFSILDPETTYSLPQKQLRNGIVDSFVHVLEQYITYDLQTPLQDRQAEAILLTLLELAPRIQENNPDYEARASFMWCSTQALNGLIGCGGVADFASHDIGHELTAFFGLAHAESIAVVLPALWKHQLMNKIDKLAQYADRIWNIPNGSSEKKAQAAIDRTIDFFHSLDMPTRLRDYQIEKDSLENVIQYFQNQKFVLGERKNIAAPQIRQILQDCW